MTRIDASSNAFDQPIAVGGQPIGLAFADRSLWVIDLSDETVTRIDPVTGKNAQRRSRLRVRRPGSQAVPMACS